LLILEDQVIGVSDEKLLWCAAHVLSSDMKTRLIWGTVVLNGSHRVS